MFFAHQHKAAGVKTKQNVKQYYFILYYNSFIVVKPSDMARWRIRAFSRSSAEHLSRSARVSCSAASRAPLDPVDDDSEW